MEIEIPAGKVFPREMGRHGFARCGRVRGRSYIGCQSCSTDLGSRSPIMTEPPIGICCYLQRDIIAKPCAECSPTYGCRSFGTSPELIMFEANLPLSWPSEGLPLDTWPNMLPKI